MNRYILLSLLLLCLSIAGHAADRQLISRASGIDLYAELTPTGRDFKNFTVKNTTADVINVYRNGKHVASISKNSEKSFATAREIRFSFKGDDDNIRLLYNSGIRDKKASELASRLKGTPAPPPQTKTPEPTPPTEPVVVNPVATNKTEKPSEPEKPAVADNSKRKDNDKRERENTRETPTVTDNQPMRESIPLEQIKSDFATHLATLPFYNADDIAEQQAYIDRLVGEFAGMSDGQKQQYVLANNIKAYIEQERETLQKQSDGCDQMIDDFLGRYSNGDIADMSATRDELRNLVIPHLDRRNDQLQQLSQMANVEYKPVEPPTKGSNWPALLAMLAVLALLAGGAYWIYRNKGQGRNRRPATSTTAPAAGGPTAPAATGRQTAGGGADGIVVRRRTTSVLKRQDISDVEGNDSYLCIETADMCPDSAVRRIYIKNTCVKEIYNMYAEDLRNPANPKEDGCMVLGRWVLDGQSDKFDVTLEQVVMPGDDAVFAEYELNFGGKIKLSVNEKLRRLRRESGLQYDLTCWVHSHPGLGVFFSSSDNNVHNQLKHPTQPYFLTAMVVDILTPDQTTGIFTFKRDGTVTAQGDLQRMYSLEELYQWAIASERSAFNPQDYFNALTGCHSRRDECRGVELSNGTVIDITQLTAAPTTGLVGYVQGYTRTKGDLAEYVADRVTSERTLAGKELVGCLVVDSHRSLPSIRRTVADELAKLHFVLFYSTSTDELTAIPVHGGELCSDENYYGVNKLEDLKIWTRRKR